MARSLRRKPRPALMQALCEVEVLKDEVAGALQKAIAVDVSLR